jgi:excisionase family DNA binding protein
VTAAQAGRPAQFVRAKLFRADSAAAYLGISQSKLYELQARGEITPKRLDGRSLYLVEDLDAYAEALPDKERS